MSDLYADIVLPLAQGAFSYRVGDALREDIALGRCVVVSLGRSKIYVGVVWRLYSERPNFKNIKSIETYLPNAPTISQTQMRFWEWLAEYYMCTLGEVMRSALPSALKPKGFSPEQFEQNVYRPLTVQYISLHPSITNEATLNHKLDSLKRAKRQHEAVVEYLEQVGDGGVFTGEVLRRSINATSVVVRELERKEVFSLTSRELAPGELPPLPKTLPRLTPLQESALEQIREGFSTKDVVLLHGVTGSGKTEIYIHLIYEQLAAGHDVLYLMPEIAMTTQLVERIKLHFGERVITYHSSFSERVRVESFRRANLSRGGELILGVRSSMFLPTDNLGLIVVDEEHDGSYKNTDLAPRYHARDSVVMLAHISGAKSLLGSATPSLESYTNATEGKYSLVTLTERYGGATMPHIFISDTIRAVKRGERKVHFNKILLDKIDAALVAHEQVMLFQNRRGFSTYIECGECGWVASCPDCNVTLTLHKSDGQLRCHYCGHSSAISHACPACKHTTLEPRGFGTEKVEQELAQIFPSARIERLDRDAARSVRSFNAIISSFERGQTDILVGTQMITKGFDFEGVSLVGILNADNLLAYPDFRASERAYQLMTQVAGRAGRRLKQGEVVIQTSQPEHPIIVQVAAQDYQGMVRSQLFERHSFLYPPYCRMVALTLKHRDKGLLWRAAYSLGDDLRGVFGRRILGPQPPAVDRIKGEYLLSFTLKIERKQSFVRAKARLQEAIAKLQSQREFRSVQVVCNVDPQ